MVALDHDSGFSRSETWPCCSCGRTPGFAALGFFFNLPLSLPLARSPMCGSAPLDLSSRVHEAASERRRLSRTECEPVCRHYSGPLEFIHRLSIKALAWY